VLFAARCYASAAYVVMRCPSVTFVDSVKMKKNRLFSLSGSHTILVSPRQTSWRYFDGDPLTRTSNSGRNRNSEAIYGSIACCERLERQVTASATSAIHSAATDHGDLMTLVARKRRSLLTAGEETTTKCL